VLEKDPERSREDAPRFSRKDPELFSLGDDSLTSLSLALKIDDSLEESLKEDSLVIPSLQRLGPESLTEDFGLVSRGGELGV